jgi:hypothetical protein
MNSKLLPLTLAIASALIIVPRTAHAISYTFDVDASSGIGTGYFSIDLPNTWPGNIGHSTRIQATSFSGFLAPGDAWVALAISLNEPLELPDNAVLLGASKKLSFFTTAGIGITPVEAVDDIPGVSLRAIVVADGGVTAMLLAISFLGLLIWHRRLKTRLPGPILNRDLLGEPSRRKISAGGSRFCELLGLRDHAEPTLAWRATFGVGPRRAN